MRLGARLSGGPVPVQTPPDQHQRLALVNGLLTLFLVQAAPLKRPLYKYLILIAVKEGVLGHGQVPVPVMMLVNLAASLDTLSS